MREPGEQSRLFLPALSIVNEGNDPQVLLPPFDTAAPEERVRVSITVKFEACDRDVFDACRRTTSGAD